MAVISWLEFEPLFEAFDFGCAKTGLDANLLSDMDSRTANTCIPRVGDGTSTLAVSDTTTGSKRQFGTAHEDDSVGRRALRTMFQRTIWEKCNIVETRFAEHMNAPEDIISQIP